MSIEPRFYDKKIVFVCSPSSGDDTKHIENARRYCQFVFNQGAVPFAPILYFPQFLDDKDEEQHQTTVGAGLVILAEADELWAFGDKLTGDMRLELGAADAFAIPMRFFNADCVEKGESILDC